MSRTHRTRWKYPPSREVPHTGLDLWGGLVLTRRVRWRGECGCAYCCSGTKRFFKRLDHKTDRRQAKKDIRNERP